MPFCRAPPPNLSRILSMARFHLGLPDHALVRQVAAVGFRRVAKIGGADADQAERACRRRRLSAAAAPARTAATASCVGGRSGAGAGQECGTPNP